MLKYDRQMAKSLLDDTDRALIAELKRDARTPVVAIAKQLGLSRATVQNRINRLESSGVIVGYSAQLGHEISDDAVRAIMNLAIEGNRAPTVVRALSAHPFVTAIYSTNGRWDMIVEISAPSLVEFDRALNEMRQLDGISSSESCLLLSRFK